MRARVGTILVSLWCGVVLLPLCAGAQQASKVYRIGFLRAAAPQAADFEAFRQGLHELGWIEGQNVVIEQRHAAGEVVRLADLAAELVRLRVDVIVVDGTLAAKAAKAAAPTTPIIFTLVSDPVGSGLVASLARPGGMVTGQSNLGTDLAGKRVQLLKEAVPEVSRVAVLVDPVNSMTSQLQETQAATQSLALRLQVVEADKRASLPNAFSAAARERAGALVTLTSPLFFSERARIVELAARHRIPAMFPEREFVDAGGLMSYGVSFPALWRRAAAYADKILKGVKPADLPVEQPTRFELVVNLKTAKSLGLTIPRSILARADEIVQ